MCSPPASGIPPPSRAPRAISRFAAIHTTKNTANTKRFGLVSTDSTPFFRRCSLR